MMYKKDKRKTAGRGGRRGKKVKPRLTLDNDDAESARLRAEPGFDCVLQRRRVGEEGGVRDPDWGVGHGDLVGEWEEER